MNLNHKVEKETQDFLLVFISKLETIIKNTIFYKENN